MIIRVFDTRRVHDASLHGDDREYRDFLLFGDIPGIEAVNKALPGISEIRAGSSASAPKANRDFMLMEYEGGQPAAWEELV